MARREHVSETAATRFLRSNRVNFAEHLYDYVEHGGAQQGASALGVDPYCVVKTLVMQDEHAHPLLVLMHGNRTVSTKNLARQTGHKSIEPCLVAVANRHSGYLVGGTSPFATRKPMPVFYEHTILGLPRMLVNGGRRGYLVELDPTECMRLLGARSVQCALAE